MKCELVFCGDIFSLYVGDCSGAEGQPAVARRTVCAVKQNHVAKDRHGDGGRAPLQKSAAATELRKTKDRLGEGRGKGAHRSTGNVWQTLNVGKSPRNPNNLIISGAHLPNMSGATVLKSRVGQPGALQELACRLSNAAGARLAGRRTEHRFLRLHVLGWLLCRKGHCDLLATGCCGRGSVHELHVAVRDAHNAWLVSHRLELC